MSSGGLPQRLSTDEVTLVLRRAAELEAEAGRSGLTAADGFDPEAVEAAAGEVGLSPLAVRQALGELRIGALAPGHRRPDLRTRLVGPDHVEETRLVTASPDLVHATADEFFGRQTMELRRRQADLAVYRPCRDLPAVVRRLVNHDGALRLAGVRAVSVTVSPVAPPGTGDRPSTGPQCMVRVVATLKPGRTGVTTAASASGLVVMGTTGAISVVAGDPTALVAGTSVVASMGAGAMGLRRRWRRRRSEEIGEVLATLLDALT